MFDLGSRNPVTLFTTGAVLDQIAEPIAEQYIVKGAIEPRIDTASEVYSEIAFESEPGAKPRLLRTALPINRSIPEKQVAIVVLELLLAFPLGLLLVALGIHGLAWILSGIAAGAIVLGTIRRTIDGAIQPNPTSRRVGLALVGFTIGGSVAYAQLGQMSAQLPVFVFLTLLMLLSGTAIGYLYSRLSQTNLLTAMLATVPGGIGVMASIAADYGRNVTQVALVQVLRITAVILLIPFVAKSLAGQPGASAIPLGQPSFHFNLPYLGLVGLSLLAVVGGVAVAKRLRIPAAFFFGAVVVGIGFNPLLQAVPGFSAVEFTPPPLLGMLGNILLGLTIGEYWGSGFTLRKRAIAHALLPVVLTILAGLLTAWIAMRLTSWDWLTCLLVTAPGGAPEMILAALALHHNVETVTAGHLVRLMAINASLPLWVWLFRALDRTTTAGAEGSPQPAGSSH